MCLTFARVPSVNFRCMNYVQYNLSLKVTCECVVKVMVCVLPHTLLTCALWRSDTDCASADTFSQS